MSALREIIAIFDIAVNDEQLKDAERSVDGFVGKLKALGAVLAGFKIVKTILEFGEGVRDSAREIEFNAGRMEMGTDEYQRLAQVASNYGMTMEQLQIANTLFVRGLSGMGGTMGTFSARTNQAQEGMRNLGLDAHQFRGQKLEQILPVIADAMGKIEDPMERVAIGLRLFGHRGRSIMPMLAQGGDELRRQFAAAVPVFEELTIKSADRAAISGKQLGRVWDNLINNSFGRALMDAMTAGANALIKVVVWLKELSKNSEIGKGVLAALGIVGAAVATAIIIAWWPVLAPLLAIIAAFAALALIIDDIIVFMEGGQSALGDLFDDILGPGGADAARLKIEQVWDFLKTFVSWIFGAKVDWGKFFDQTTLEAIKLIFDKLKAAMEWFLSHAKAAGGWVADMIEPTNSGGHVNTPEQHNALINAVEHGMSYVPSAELPVDHWRGVPETATGANAGTGAMLNPNFNFYGNVDSEKLAADLNRTFQAHHGKTLRDAHAAVGGSK